MYDDTPDLATGTPHDEARRQLQICNACRYCEGYCSAFPAITRLRAFADGDITQIANLCHNCCGCYYACQYTEPHEFALNLPQALAQVRTQSWQDYAWPAPLARLFHRHAYATVAATLLGIAALFLLIQAVPAPASGTGFYAVLSHSAMIALFAPLFLLPLAALALGLRRYWRDVGGARPTLAQWRDALAQAAQMRNLKGGHGEGCNFEEGARFTPARRMAHHAVMYGFLLCFASTSTGTILHYGFDMPAPYSLWSLPKLFGITGGLLLTAGCVWMLALKARAEAHLSDPETTAADTAFVGLLGMVAASGLALYALGQTVAMPALLALHLGAVASFFLLTPYTKMAHGFFRLAALLKDAQARGV
ncbi:citrate/tricarballylate utilization protein [Litoreibacter ponti]|uniref:Citrate/tricarballylate utilization protein n=1 Tax=Litoreibacter ponti TaxID=1510457 RepID=A0A2T6BEB0_9RHOB|nr:tricarballylate utilization 4Fe-4S protein TcuB [Litoreibacter ponti]PTX54405.1 citrate/tricarballylate utilization protein [Litoreibacter ponti]